ncbi:MAG: hypothetical protein D6698_09370 [Gammaproteobacteria bacterium]|nr:MAG: hypothetical protein D6698_09370 [Gammaproteobacteria bacterium]
MDRSEALEKLGLPENCSDADIEVLYRRHIGEIQALINTADSEASRQKYERIRDEIEHAHEILVPQRNIQSTSAAIAGGSNNVVHISNRPMSESEPSASARKPRNLGIQLGSMIAGRFEILEALSERRLSSVYRAFDRQGGREVAIKLFYPRLLARVEDRETFLREANILRNLSHPHCVDIMDVGTDGTYHYLVMELFRGKTLRELMEERFNRNTAFSVAEMLDIIQPVLDTLEALHAHTYCGDLRPENILVNERGEVKLLLGSVARMLHASDRSSGTIMKSVYYRAPEQLNAPQKVDHRVDQYAVAVLVHELLTGTVPVGRVPPLNEVCADLDEGLAQAISRAMSPHVDGRFPMLKDLSEAFSRSMKKKPDRRTASASTSHAYSSRFPWLVLGLCLLFLAIGGLWWWFNHNPASLPVEKPTAAKEQNSAGKIKNIPAIQQPSSRQDYERTAEMEGRILAMNERLEDVRRMQDLALKEAERDVRQQQHALELARPHDRSIFEVGLQAARDELAYQEKVSAFLNRHIFESEDYMALKGRLNLAASYRRDGLFEQSIQLYQEIERTLSKLITSVFQISDIVADQIRVDEARSAWHTWATKNKFTRQKAYQAIEKDYQAVQKLLASGQYEQAERNLHDLHDRYVRLYTLLPSVMKERAKTRWLIKQWKKFSDQHGLRDFPGAAAVDREFQLAERHYIDGDYVGLNTTYAALTKKYNELIKKARNQEVFSPPMVKVPGGVLQIGPAESLQEVTLGGFKIGRYEVTQAQWKMIMGNNPSHFKGENRPVENVSWNDAQEYIRRLNALTGKHFRLPTEIEWEYAARAGSQTPFSWGESIGVNQANCDGCGSQWDNKETAPVGSFQPNAFGLYDMQGNVWEWVQDCWAETVRKQPDGAGPCTKRVMRGGSWVNRPKSLELSNRVGNPPESHFLNTGFRIVQD